MYSLNCDLTRRRELCPHDDLLGNLPIVAIGCIIIATVIISFVLIAQEFYVGTFCGHCADCWEYMFRKESYSSKSLSFQGSIQEFSCPHMGPSGAHRKYKAQQRDSHKTEAGRYVQHTVERCLQQWPGIQSSVEARPGSKPRWFCLALGLAAAATRMLIVRFSTEQMGSRYCWWWQMTYLVAGSRLCDDLVQPTQHRILLLRQHTINMGTEPTHWNLECTLFIRLHTT